MSWKSISSHQEKADMLSREILPRCKCCGGQMEITHARGTANFVSLEGPAGYKTIFNGNANCRSCMTRDHALNHNCPSELEHIGFDEDIKKWVPFDQLVQRYAWSTLDREKQKWQALDNASE